MRARVCCGLGQQYPHPWQIDFLQRHKQPSLAVLLKHMPEVEAMRFLHDVVDVSQLEGKLKQNFPGDGEKVVEEVRLCVCVCLGVGWDAVMWVFMWKNTGSLHTP